MKSETKSIIVPGLHPKVSAAVEQTLTECHASALFCAVHCGLRTAEESERLYALGRTVANPSGKTADKPMGSIVSNARAWESPHNYGLAVDIVFKDSKGRWTWSVPEEQWQKLGQVGKLFGFSWGGDWKTLKDRPHFEMKGSIPSWRYAKELVFSKGIEAVWKLV